MAVLGYLPNQKVVWDIFYMIFPLKCSVFNTPSMDKVSTSYLFSFLRYQTKCVTKFLFRQLMTSETLRFILKQWLIGRKRLEDRITKI